jgi:hypothetical protein
MLLLVAGSALAPSDVGPIAMCEATRPENGGTLLGTVEAGQEC